MAAGSAGILAGVAPGQPGLALGSGEQCRQAWGPKWGAEASRGFWGRGARHGMSRLGAWVALDTGRVQGQALRAEAHIREAVGAAEVPAEAPGGGAPGSMLADPWFGQSWGAGL